MEQDKIIKALECCKIRACDICPYDVFSNPTSTCNLKEDALELIKELTEENEKLKAQKYYLHEDGRIEMIPTIESVKANTVREMQAEIINRCVKGGIYPAFVASTINQIAKEMIDNAREV